MREYSKTLWGLRSPWNPYGVTEYGDLCEKIEDQFYKDHGFWPSDEYVQDAAEDILESRKYHQELSREMDENE